MISELTAIDWPGEPFAVQPLPLTPHETRIVALKRPLLRTISALFAALLLSPAVAAAGISPQPFRTGLFGAAAGQTVRINVVNTAAIPEGITLRFCIWDAAGRLLFDATEGPLSRGTGRFVDFEPVPDDGTPPPAGQPVPEDGRVVLRAEVIALPLGAGLPPDRQLNQLLEADIHVTLELYDTGTGRTELTMPFVAVGGVSPTPFAEVAGVNPQPFRTGLFGATAGQTVRVNLLNTADPGVVVKAHVRVFDASGALLLDTDADLLSAGRGTFVDFLPVPEDGTPSGGPVPDDNTPGGGPVPNDGRVQLRAEVVAGAALDGTATPTARLAVQRATIQLTLEVFDTASGRAIFTMPFAERGGISPVPFRLVGGPAGQ